MKRSIRYRKSDGQAGSALFIILIAVMLFAALSYTVAQMMRGGNPQVISEQKAELYASEILDYARGLRGAAQALRIGDCPPLGISFENEALAGYGHTPAAASSCLIFSSAGGGASYLEPTERWLDPAQAGETLFGEWYFPAHVCIPDIGTAGSGAGCSSDSADNESLIAVLPYLKRQVCTAINEALGHGSAPLAETGNAWPPAGTKFGGTQADGERLDQPGRMAGCFEGDGANTPAAGTYHFFQVLLPR